MGGLGFHIQNVSSSMPLLAMRPVGSGLSDISSSFWVVVVAEEEEEEEYVLVVITEP